MATDPIQKLKEAIVAILDTNASIVAITGYPGGSEENANIVAWETLADMPAVERPMLAYVFIVARELAADGDTREALFQIIAAGPQDSKRNELLYVVEQVLEQPAFLALISPLGPLDAFVDRRIRRGFNLDVTLRVAA